MKYFLPFLFSLICTLSLKGQPLEHRYSHFGEMFVPQFSSAPFPHPLRADGRIYNKIKYPADIHYSDSSVLIFVFPEGPKDAPDSFGGKLEEKDGLKNLINDVLNFLKDKRKINSNKIGKIILAGHSGAYRVISFCVLRGGLTKKYFGCDII